MEKPKVLFVIRVLSSLVLSSVAILLWSKLRSEMLSGKMAFFRSILPINSRMLLESSSTSILKPNIVNGSTSAKTLDSFYVVVKNGGDIDESSLDKLPFATAVERFIALNETRLTSALSSGISGSMTYSSSTDFLKLFNLRRSDLRYLIDIVLPTRSSNLVAFFETWKSLIENIHVIIVFDGELNERITIPSWVNYELYSTADIRNSLGSNAWIISQDDSSIRSFGYLVSDKKYIFTLNDDCFPSRSSSGIIDALKQHMLNLLCPSNPDYFNTLYDPYLPDREFSRGFPYSSRDGFVTAISHGLWTHAADYDGITQVLKPRQRNSHVVDASITIPWGVHYSMSSLNLAFDRELIGPAMYEGIMGKGQPIGKFGDIFAGWISKTILDNLKFGVKSGIPYVAHHGVVHSHTRSNSHSHQLGVPVEPSMANTSWADVSKEYMGLKWQDKILSALKSVNLAEKHHNALEGMEELVEVLSAQFANQNNYFTRWFSAMKIWVDLWKKKSIQEIRFRSSQSKHRPTNESTCAILTVVHNENILLPIWLRYYTRHARAEDIWVLDHNTNDGSTLPEKIPHGVHVQRLFGDSAFMPHHFLNRQVEMYQQRLFRWGYPCVLFTEIDEFVVPDPDKYPLGLSSFLQEFSADAKNVLNFKDKPYSPKFENTIKANCHQMGHLHNPDFPSNGSYPKSFRPKNYDKNTLWEDPIDWNKNLMTQRHYVWPFDPIFSKPVLTRVPLKYGPGFHNAFNWTTNEQLNVMHHPHLFMLHLHSIDYDYCMAREYSKYLGSKNMHAEERNKGMGNHFSLYYLDLLQEGYVCQYANGFTPLVRLNDSWSSVVI